MSLLRNKVFLAILLGHFINDIFSNAGPVLITFFSIPLALSTVHIGLAIGLSQFAGSLSQPFFGWWVDKIGSRWLGPGSVAWTIFFLTLSVFVAQQTHSFSLFLIPFVLSSIGSGAFHPLGVKHAAEQSGGLAATGTGLFFGFGQTGLAIGPVLTGMILSNIGPSGIYGLALLAIPLLIFMAVALRQVQALPSTAPPPAEKVVQDSSSAPLQWRPIILLALLVGLRSWAYLGTVTFLPKMFQNMDWSATYYGLITGAYWLGSALTTAVAGGLADRWGRRQLVFFTLLFGSLPLYFLPLYSGWQAFPLAVMSGALLGASQSIVVVIAQDLLPGKRGLTSGIALGYLFGIGSFAAWGVGGLAEVWGLGPVIQAGTVVGLLAAGLALLLPKTRETARPYPKNVPV